MGSPAFFSLRSILISAILAYAQILQSSRQKYDDSTHPITHRFERRKLRIWASQGPPALVHSQSILLAIKIIADTSRPSKNQSVKVAEETCHQSDVPEK